MTRAALIRKLRSLEACDEAVSWLKSTDHATLQEAWDGCERADWMLWLLDKLGAEQGLMVSLACDMADSVQHLWLARFPDDDRPANAIRTARAWCEGQATREDCARASWDAGDAARAAWAAAGDAAGAAARAAAHQQMAALIRKRVPNPEEVAS